MAGKPARVGFRYAVFMYSFSPPGYAELDARSNFSFRRGASHPRELVLRAHELGYRALALCDECSVAGIVRAWEAARECGLALISGSRFATGDGLELILLAPDREAWSQLCRLITTARRRAPKGRYRLERGDLETDTGRLLAIWKPGPEPDPADARWLHERFEQRLWLGATRLLAAGERARFEQLARQARTLGLDCVACGDVRMHRRGRRALLDALTALEVGKPLAECGLALAANGERHLRPRETLAELYPPEWLNETLAIAERCHFDPGQLDYRYPAELVPAPYTPSRWLRHLAMDGMQQRFPDGAPESVLQLVARELKLIEEMSVEAFFLTVHDIVQFARSRGILCQGRGSAANSAVCYCLGITEVDPAQQQLLFERFLSKERNEPPDIDVDFEHERREEVLQYIYAKYGRARAALAATVISYRPKSALKDIARALGLDHERVNRLTASLAWWDREQDWPERLRQAGFDPESRSVQQWLVLAGELIGMPRHLSQHVGGMVIADQPLHHLVPVENAAMDGRTIIQWDKDDLETLGLLKVDCLALGMLTVLRKAMDLVNQSAPSPELTLATLPRDDPATWDMLCRGDAVGVFQVESRAQMAMLPRLKPRCFRDLVVEVAIVRPGPIQGDMVHPYLERREHPERVDYPDPALKRVLERTLGVPIFQEQVMQIAIVAAGFTPGEADQLRRAMAAWKRRGGLEPFRERLLGGMRARGYDEQFAERIYHQILGFGDYGFPESHAASFALLTWFSAWLKCKHPAAFAAALLNSQPMGFYAPAQIIADARRHGVRVLPVDVRFSDRDCTLEAQDPGTGAIRLGLRMVKGLGHEAAERLVAARLYRPFVDLDDMVERARPDRRSLSALTEAGALKALAGHRRKARWQTLAARAQGDLLADARLIEHTPTLAPPSAGEDMLADHAATGFSLDHHPIAQLRPRLGRHVLSARQLRDTEHGKHVSAAGQVTHRQRPGTASGVIFLSLADETGIINVIVWPKLAQRQRAEVLQAGLLKVRGKLQNANGSQHLVAEHFETLDPWLPGLRSESRDFH
ncbi:MAG: error-prone DNA polymerase [Wenzhouxiangellaceae bacterium]|nr:error-prone DNA polymerase [Wenzhouxiangellaceae bacterium]